MNRVSIWPKRLSCGSIIELRLTNKAVRTNSVRSLPRGLGVAIESSIEGVADLGGLELPIGNISMSTL